MTEGDHTPMAISVNLVLSFVCSCMRERRVGEGRLNSKNCFLSETSTGIVKAVIYSV